MDAINEQEQEKDYARRSTVETKQLSRNSWRAYVWNPDGKLAYMTDLWSHEDPARADAEAWNNIRIECVGRDLDWWKQYDFSGMVYVDGVAVS